MMLVPRNHPLVGTPQDWPKWPYGEVVSLNKGVEDALVSLSWEVGPDGTLVIPEGDSRHFHQVKVNGIPVTALRDTCASQSMVAARLVSPAQ